MSQNDVSSSQSQSRKGVALITGASRGIGRGIALRLAGDGYDIAVNGQTSTPELDEVVKAIEGKGRRVLAVPGDVSEESIVIDIIQRTVSTLGLGGLDVVRNNVPLSSPSSSSRFRASSLKFPACDALLNVIALTLRPVYCRW